MGTRIIGVGLVDLVGRRVVVVLVMGGMARGLIIVFRVDRVLTRNGLI